MTRALIDMLKQRTREVKATPCQPYYKPLEVAHDTDKVYYIYEIRRNNH